MASKSQPVKIHVVDGAPLVWNPRHVEILCEHRVWGNMEGLPTEESKEETQSFPMVIMKESALLLQEMGVIELVEFPDFKGEPTEKMQHLMKALEESSFRDQRAKYYKDRKAQIEKNASKIIKSAKEKNAKLGPSHPDYIPEEELSESRILDAKFSKIPPPKPGSLLVESHKEYPFLDTLKTEKAVFQFPRTEHEKMRYTVYKDLHRTNYWVIDGGEEGFDFILYKGRPNLVHGHLAVKVVASDVGAANPESKKGMYVRDMVACLRVCNAAGRKFVKAYVRECGQVRYKTINYEGKDFGGK